MTIQNLDPVTIASAIAAAALAATRLLSSAKPIWSKLPAWLQGLLPVLVLVLPQIAQSAAGVKTGLDLANLLVVAIALLLPGSHSHTISASKPNGPGSAALVLLFVVVFPLQGCAGVNWPKVMQCGEPVAQAELEVVSKVLAGSGDVATQLEDVAKSYAPSTVECAVQEIVSGLAARKGAARDNHSIERGQAFLRSVQQ